MRSAGIVLIADRVSQSNLPRFGMDDQFSAPIGSQSLPGNIHCLLLGTMR